MKLKLINWLKETFGENEPGDYFDLSERISLTEAPQGKAVFEVTEINLNLNKKHFDENILKRLNELKKELDLITENSIRKVDFVLFDKTQFMKEKSRSGKSLLIKVEILHQRRI